MTKFLCCMLASTGLAAGVGEEKNHPAEPAVDKSQFHLFNPTPSEYLRDMTTDGPGATDSPYTVDAGHFQVEMALVNYATHRISTAGVTKRVETWNIAPLTLKVGLLNQADAQLVMEPYNLVYETTTGGRVTRRGFGDSTLRVKLNCWGNDTGRTALALMPFVKFPTSDEGFGNDNLEGGLIVPLSVELPADFYLSMSGSIAKVRHEGEPLHHTEYTASIALSRSLLAEFEGYVECFNVLSTESGVGRITTFNTGLLYWLTDDLQLNAGVNIGLTSRAQDWNPFVGLAWRF